MNILHWKVADIIKETNDAYSFVLMPSEDKKINYQAGQFLTFIFNHRDLEIRRSYSIASTPGIDKDIMITVKRIPNGEISRLLIDHKKPGDTLISILPAGRFTIETNKTDSRQFFFIVAGSGIVPVFSLIKKILNEEPLSAILLIYQNHNEGSIIYKKQIEKIQQENPDQFRWISMLSKPKHKPHIIEKLNNFLLKEIIELNIDEQKTSMFYLCGPVSFMRMAQFTLKWMGFEDEQIKKENFTVDFIPPPLLMTDTSSKQVIVHFDGETFKFKTAYPNNILQAALAKNILLPYSCRSGRCSSCVAKCLSGKIKMSNNEVLTEKDLQSGLVLTCVGFAETDVELEF